MNAQPLSGKSAIVTGAAQGLGAALALRLAQEGAEVVVADLNEAGAQTTASQIAEATGRRTLAIGCNVASEEQVAAMIERTVAEFDSVDVLVANAGVVISGAVDEFDVARWRTVIEVNLVGYMICAKYAFAQMKRQGGGSIVQINSKSGKKGSFKNSAYAASKFGGIGLTQSIALEGAELGIRCNAVCPGNLLDSPLWTESLFKQYAANQGITEEEVRKRYVDQVPMKRPCTYNDVANVVVFLASDQSSYMTGQAINVTGGQEMR